MKKHDFIKHITDNYHAEFEKEQSDGYLLFRFHIKQHEGVIRVSLHPNLNMISVNQEILRNVYSEGRNAGIRKNRDDIRDVLGIKDVLFSHNAIIDDLEFIKVH